MMVTRTLRLARVVSAGAAFVVAAAGVSGVAQADSIGGDRVAAAPEGACMLRPSGHAHANDEKKSCLSVTATLSNAPAVNQQATLDFTVDAAVARPDVQVSVELPANLRWVKAPSGMAEHSRASRVPRHNGFLREARLARPMAAGQRTHYSGVVEAIAAGATEITVRASADPATATETGADSVFLTVGSTATQSRFGISGDTGQPAVQGTGPTGPSMVKPNRAKGLGPANRISKPAAQMASPSLASPGGTACAKGTFRYIDHTGAARPALGWVVEVVDADGGASDSLASAFVGWSGEYNLCFDNGDEDGTGQDVFVQFWADAGDWRVVQTGIAAYHFWSSTKNNVADGSTTNFGTLQPSSTFMRAAEAYDAVFAAWQTVPGGCWDSRGACRAVVVLWTPDSTDGTYYQPSTNDVHLAAADPDAPITVAHEVTHSIMDDVYDDNMPSTPSCNPHNIRASTSAGCAWVEGFAEWFPTVIFNDPFFRWPNGSSLNLETPTWRSANWSNGDTVEGRVAGALIDLSDTTNEGTDRVGEGMGNIWSTFQDHNSTTFARFWADRGTDGFSRNNNALGSLYQNTIDYGFTP
jgi:hypothetical protein